MLKDKPELSQYRVATITRGRSASLLVALWPAIAFGFDYNREACIEMDPVFGTKG